MQTKEQDAADAEKQILELKDVSLESLKSFNAAKKGGVSVERQRELFGVWTQDFVALLNCVESCISKSELLGANRSEFWAKELANTASNMLDTIPRFYERLQDEAVRLELEPIVPSPNAYSAMQNAVLIYNPEQVKELKENFERLQLPVRGFTHPAKMNTMYTSKEKAAMLTIIFVFVAALLGIGVFKTEWTPQGFVIVRAILAVFAAALAAIAIPGFLEVKLKVKRSVYIRATGAIAVFVVVFLINSPQLVIGKNPTGGAPTLPAPR